MQTTVGSMGSHIGGRRAMHRAEGHGEQIGEVCGVV